MPHRIRVMLVDDSAVVRGLFDRALSADPNIEMVGSAGSAEIAITLLKKTPVDVILLDVEMPGMSGIEVLPELLKISPTSRVIMSSSLTKQNAEVSIKAMELGASDVIAKPSTRDTGEVGDFYRSLISKIKALAPHKGGIAPRPAEVKPAASDAPTKVPSGYLDNPIHVPTKPLRQPNSLVDMQALAIASSTGGPQALLSIFREFKGKALRVPIFITQHMPPNFTTILADHISKASGMECHEAVGDEAVKPGVIYIAPGDYHMTAVKKGAGVILKLDQDPPENFCRPSADPMLRSLAKIYREKLLVTVLTGIGTDGARGAGEVIAAGGGVIAQDEATSVVYGMPKAVADAKMTSAVMPLNAIAGFLQRALA
jgi:two-component system chemotaxis response regulator CheB